MVAPFPGDHLVAEGTARGSAALAYLLAAPALQYPAIRRRLLTPPCLSPSGLCTGESLLVGGLPDGLVTALLPGVEPAGGEVLKGNQGSCASMKLLQSG